MSATFFRGNLEHKIFSTAILSLPLIQEGQLSVSGERMCTILVKRLGLSLPSKSVIRYTDHLRHDPHLGDGP